MSATAEEIETALIETLRAIADGEGPEIAEADAFLDSSSSTFEEAGLMTYNRGIVLRLANGEGEFQLTVQGPR